LSIGTLKGKKIKYKPLVLSNVENKNKRYQIYKTRSHKNSAPCFAEKTRSMSEFIFCLGGRQQTVLQTKMEYLKTRTKLTPEKAKCPLTNCAKIKARYKQHKRYPLESICFPVLS